MMKKLLVLMTSLIVLLSFTDSGWTQEARRYPIMQPDRETREQWYQEWLNAPQAYIDPEIAATLDWGPRPNLLDKIPYTPSERNQASCGNCWVWAGTALLEILHNVEHGANNRLSIQRFDSCFNSEAHNACSGGNLGTFLNYYNNYNEVPWSNTNAYFQDGGGTTTLACASVGTSPSYSGAAGAFINSSISTAGIAQVDAIAHIKNVLNQQKGVQFAFWLANDADWGTFYDFWDLSETNIWNPDTTCGHTWVNGQGGGHAVVIVGYNDDDADSNNHYWIVLNSWGTSGGVRPNGLFRMKMNMNYSCIMHESGYSDWYCREFRTVDTQYDPFSDYNSLYMAAKGAATNNIFYRKKNSGGAWGSWAQIAGTTTHPPSMANFNTRQYMAVKGAATPKVYIRSVNYQGAWSSWAEVPGGSTSAGPTLVTYRNRLYVFAKGSSTGKIWYNSMSTNGAWSGWLEVAGANANDSPAAIVLNDRLVIYQVDGTGHIYVKQMNNDGTWGGWAGFLGGGFEMQTNVGVSATTFNNRALLVVKGLYGTPFSNAISYVFSADGNAGSYYGWNQVPGGATTSRPYVAWGPTPNQFYVTAKGAATSTMWENHYDSIEGWIGWTQSAGGSTHAPSVNTYYLGDWP